MAECVRDGIECTKRSRGIRLKTGLVTAGQIRFLSFDQQEHRVREHPPFFPFTLRIVRNPGGQIERAMMDENALTTKGSLLRSLSRCCLYGLGEKADDRDHRSGL